MQTIVQMMAYTSWLACAASQSPVAVTGDDAAGRAYIAALHDPRSDVRESAARALRQVAAQRGDGTLGLAEYDHTEAYWKERVAQVHPGLNKADALRLLPPLPRSIEPTVSHAMASGTMDCYLVAEQLDYHWQVAIWYRYPKGNAPAKVMYAPELAHAEVMARVFPPPNYAGTWINWYVNGQPAEVTRYQTGHVVALTEYFETGQKRREVQYSNGGGDSTEVGWYRNAKPEHRGQTRKREKDGLWTYWYPDGHKQRETHFQHGARRGLESEWNDQGVLTRQHEYRDDKVR